MFVVDVLDLLVSGLGSPLSAYRLPADAERPQIGLSLDTPGRVVRVNARVMCKLLAHDLCKRCMEHDVTIEFFIKHDILYRETLQYSSPYH